MADALVDAAWCLGLWSHLNEGGVWGVPRSGLVFTKRDGKLLLTNRMPHDPAMPLSAIEFAAWQAVDYDQIRHRFSLAGISVEDATEEATC